MIEVEHLTKYYSAWPACRDVTFNVEEGEILGFLGPNGAGKTTTMRMITGYLPPTEGTVRVAGIDVQDKSLEARRHIGYLPETVPLYTDLTTFEYLDFRGRICGMHNGKERKARIYELMDVLNLSDVSGKLIGQLSRGYRQRVGLAQAMLHNPEALILDEPTVGLDPVQITEVRNLIRDLGRDHTIILSTHLLPEVSMVCNRVVIINRGRLVALDTPIHLQEGGDATHVVELEIAGEPAAVLLALKGLQGVNKAAVVSALRDGADMLPGSGTQVSGPIDSLPSGLYSYEVESQPGGPDLRPDIATAIVGGGFGLVELTRRRVSLEDVFLRIIAQNAEETDFADEDTGDEIEGEDYYEEQPAEESYEEEETEEPVPVQSVRVRGRRVRK